MTGIKLSALENLLGAGLSLSDELLVLDVSDPTMAPTGTDKMITVAEIISGLDIGGSPSDILPVAKLTAATPNGGPGFYDPASTVPADGWWVEVDNNHWLWGDGADGLVEIDVSGGTAVVTLPGIELEGGASSLRRFTLTTVSGQAEAFILNNLVDTNPFLTITPDTVTGGTLKMWGGPTATKPSAELAARAADAVLDIQAGTQTRFLASATDTRARLLVVAAATQTTQRMVEIEDSSFNYIFSATGNGKMSFYNATEVLQQSHINDPSGGATQDAEGRAALVSILDLLEAYGLMHT